LTLRLDACIYWTGFPSIARRPHNSPAHTVKDLLNPTSCEVAPCGRFVRGEPPILHLFTLPSTPKIWKVVQRVGSPSTQDVSSKGVKS
jgi:hypothetical protein